MSQKTEVATYLLGYVQDKVESFKPNISTVLADSWFTSINEFRNNCIQLGLECIGFIKIDSTKYQQQDGSFCNIKEMSKEIREKYPNAKPGKIATKVILKRADGVLSFEENRNPEMVVYFVHSNYKKAKNREFLPLVNTDITATGSQSIKSYLKRWKIEIMFQFMKSNGFYGLNLNQNKFRNFARINAMVHIVFICYLITSYLGYLANITFAHTTSAIKEGLKSERQILRVLLAVAANNIPITEKLCDGVIIALYENIDLSTTTELLKKSILAHIGKYNDIIGKEQI